MALSFFRALDPTSANSGIVYCMAGEAYNNKEMRDLNVEESIHLAPNVIEGWFHTYSVLMGDHYDLGNLVGRSFHGHGAKGALDYLIFPLIARKLLADTQLPERQESRFINALAWLVAIPLELMRFSAAIALTLLLAPVVAIVHMVNACMSADVEAEKIASATLRC